MTATRAIADHLRADRLAEAVTEAVADLRARPADVGLRLLLIDLLVLSGDFARADAQAEIAGRLHPGEAVGLARWRGLIRGMEARRLWFAQGAVPSFPGGPTACDEAALRIGLALRAGDDAGARSSSDDLESRRGARPVVFDGEAADDLRDLDDRVPHAIEAVTDGGAYLWVDTARIASLRLAAPARPRDLAWRRAQLTLRDGSAAEVLLPLVYVSDDPTDAERLGRSTDWREIGAGLVAGCGQRCILVGETVKTLGEASTIEFGEAGEHG